MIRIPRITAAVIVALLAPFGRPAAAQESRVWIEGTSSVNSFTCTSSDVRGAGLLAIGRETGIQVPVSTLDCGNGRMNADLRAALEMNEHPTISFEVARIDVLGGIEERTRIRATGRLVIAGTAQSVEIDLESRRQNNGQVRITGSTPLMLSSFGIDPPTALMGLVKVRDRVVVHFDLVEAASEAVALTSSAGKMGAEM